MMLCKIIFINARVTFIFLLLEAIIWKFASCENCKFSFKESDSDGQIFYDLSGLRDDGPWQVIMDGNNNETLYISMCGPFGNFHMCTDPTSSVCLVKAEGGVFKNVIKNGGKYSDGPVHDALGILSFTLKDGEPCNEHNNYSTSIHLVCARNMNGVPRLLRSIQKCKIQIVWDTAVACPVKNENVTDQCTMPLPQEDFTFDLHPLQRTPFYYVNSNGHKFELNICGPVEGGHCGQSSQGIKVAACKVDSKRNSGTVIGGFSGSMLMYANEELKMVYGMQEQGSGTRTEITFKCSRNLTEHGQPKFVSEENNVYKFVFETFLACPPKPVECVVTDNAGNTYDLSPLHKEADNWESIDARAQHSDLLYHINVCGPIHRSGNYKCPGGNLGACQTSLLSNASYSLGYVKEGLKFSDNKLTITYTNGTPCRGGKYYRRTKINFFCSQKEGGPVFEAESEDCEYSFSWHTPAACPVKLLVGKDCKITDPTYGQRFDLNVMRNTSSDYVVLQENNKFRLNLCGPLVKLCNNVQGASVCLEKDNHEYAVGTNVSEPVYEEGQIKFLFKGESCKEGIGNSVVTVLLLCDHEGTKEPDMFPEVRDCEFFFVWHTKAACPPHKEIECNVMDRKGRMFDLSSLSLTSSNHIARIPGDNSKKFIINVCHSVVYGRDATCPFASGVCLFNSSEPHKDKRFHNLGDVTDGPYFENGVLKIKYEYGELCRDRDGPDHTSTVISFRCDPNIVDSEPEFMTEEACQYHFLWITAAACPYENQGSNFGNCTAQNPATKFRFNLNHLRGQKYSVEDRQGNKYELSVCSPLENTACGSGVGTCQINKKNPDKPHNYGMANANLNFQPGFLHLNYSGGEECNGKMKKNTLIQFACLSNNTKDGPTYVDEIDHCTSVIHWYTELACERQIECTASNSKVEVDLSPLISTNRNYEVYSGSRVFFINICRPIQSVLGVNCPPGSGVCLAEKDGDDYKKELSLGFPHVSPVLDSEGNVLLMYAGGSPCPGNRYNDNITSVITFKCDPNVGKGQPELQGVADGCHYNFLWRTSVICESKNTSRNGDLFKGCSVYHEQLKTYIDLTSLQQEGGTVVKGRRTTFILNLCGSADVCSGARVCDRDNTSWNSYGKLENWLYDYADNSLRLNFTKGVSCTDSVAYGAQVRLKCDPEAWFGKPEVLWEGQCIAVFLWRTNVMCQQNHGSDPNENLHKEARASTVGIVLGVMIAVAVLSIAALYFRKESHRRSVKMWFTSCLRHRDQGRVRYSKVSTADGENEASSLLGNHLEGQDIESESDDELLKM